MSWEASPTSCAFGFAMTVGILALSAMAASKPSHAQAASAASTTSIEHGSEKARAMPEPSFRTREERLNAKPLDWNSTIGTPTPRTLTDQERKASASAKRGSSSGGAPHPKAKEEARKLYPDDWK
jgi:hypothetical protein